MRPGLRVAVVGATGMVGRVLLERLESRRFPVGALAPFSSGRANAAVRFRGRRLAAPAPSPQALRSADIAFLVSSDEIALEWGKDLAGRGGWVRDDSAAFRMDPSVPLVIPEVNASELRPGRRLIAGPNCTISGLAVAAAAIHRRAGVRRVRMASYQAVSGAGREALLELFGQTRRAARSLADSEPLRPLGAEKARALPAPIAFNVFPQVGRFNADGECSEEVKVRSELRKIWGAPRLALSATTVRVPVVRGHSVAAWLELARPLTPAAAARLAASVPREGGTRSMSRASGAARRRARWRSGSSPTTCSRARRSTRYRRPRPCSRRAGSDPGGPHEGHRHHPVLHLPAQQARRPGAPGGPLLRGGREHGRHRLRGPRRLGPGARGPGGGGGPLGRAVAGGLCVGGEQAALRRGRRQARPTGRHHQRAGGGGDQHHDGLRHGLRSPRLAHPHRRRQDRACREGPGGGLRVDAAGRASYTAVSMMDKLNSTLHKPANQLFMAIVLAHWAEHLAQAWQVFYLHWPRPQAGGMLGLWFPWMVKSEFLHYAYALVMLVGFWVLREGFVGKGRAWWMAAFWIQFWHHIEHGLLQGQALAGHNLFGSPVPVSIAQLWVPRVELHLFYNAVVFVPMIAAMYYHMFPEAQDAAVQRCACAWHHHASHA
ncbi:MAG: aspartate-semialdehyde dehydrogenase [Elusimicrobia bacterium]|nr:aspartate-semialdehyde dehydrogenase [Elusimicrobiota bacterium]